MAARWQEPVVTAVAAALVLLVCLAPLAALAVDAASATSTATVALGRLARLFASTVATAGAVTAVAMLIGIALGVVFARTDLPARRAAFALHAFPLFVPPFLLALGWFHLGHAERLPGGALVAAALFSRAGLIAVLGLALAPAVTALTLLGVDGIDPSLEEAARTVARPSVVVRRILLPLARPALALAALLVFALAVSEVGVPMFLRVRTYPAAVLARLGGIAYAPGEAFLLVVPLLGLALLLGVIERRFGGLRTLSALGVRRDRPRWPLGRWRWPVAIASWLVVAAGLAPLAALAAVALAGGGLGDALQPALPSLWNSVRIAALTATAVTAVGLVLARALVDRQRSGRLVDAVAGLAFVTPAAALGVGVIAVWNRPATAFVYAASAILVVGLAGRYAVLGIRPLAAVLSRTPPHLDDAARAAGASYLRRLGRIVVPLHRRAILATWMLVAVFALRDLETVILFYPPGAEPLMVRIFTLEANGPPAVVAALALLQVALTALLLVGGASLFGRRR
jgi:iron(III) transport system permease protein